MPNESEIARHRAAIEANLHKADELWKELIEVLLATGNEVTDVIDEFRSAPGVDFETAVRLGWQRVEAVEKGSLATMCSALVPLLEEQLRSDAARLRLLETSLHEMGVAYRERRRAIRKAPFN